MIKTHCVRAGCGALATPANDTDRSRFIRQGNYCDICDLKCSQIAEEFCSRSCIDAYRTYLKLIRIM